MSKKTLDAIAKREQAREPKKGKAEPKSQPKDAG
jgi:hypothetical protein